MVFEFGLVTMYCPPCMTAPTKPSDETMATSLGSTESISVNILPLETQWENNSCAYDTIFTLLFNIWQEDPDHIQASWQEMQSVMMNDLMDLFQSHESIPVRDSEAYYTLEQI